MWIDSNPNVTDLKSVGLPIVSGDISVRNYETLGTLRPQCMTTSGIKAAGINIRRWPFGTYAAVLVSVRIWRLRMGDGWRKQAGGSFWRKAVL